MIFAGKNESACIRMFEQALGETARRQAAFDWLRGDPTIKNQQGVKLIICLAESCADAKGKVATGGNNDA